MKRDRKWTQELRARKRGNRRTAAAHARKAETMGGYYLKKDCGCCETQCDMSAEEAQRVSAWMQANLGNGMTVTYKDTKGQTHSVDGVDTFYGLRPAEEGNGPRGLGFLFDSAVGRRA